LRERWRHLPARANGQPAVGCYTWDPGSGVYRARVLDVLSLDGARIAAVTAFLAPAVFRSFGLPDELAAADGPRRASLRGSLDSIAPSTSAPPRKPM
jgi:RNA polymerase sigma-70 factor (ECF subfamily)